jgi:hypothetical protein
MLSCSPPFAISSSFETSSPESYEPLYIYIYIYTYVCIEKERERFFFSVGHVVMIGQVLLPRIVRAVEGEAAQVLAVKPLVLPRVRLYML